MTGSEMEQHIQWIPIGSSPWQIVRIFLAVLRGYVSVMSYRFGFPLLHDASRLFQLLTANPRVLQCPSQRPPRCAN